ncbi:MAG: IS5 family transposase [Planctomycetaceae bacterium]|nr:IS5 family transposase [Planctomycetaceae bacterium]
MARHRLTDGQWELIAGYFPEPAGTGRPPADPRQMVDGIVWRLRAGAPWRDLPEEFGPWETVYKHFNRWNSDGTLDKIKRALLRRIVDRAGVDADLWCVDGTIVRAARCAGGGGKKGIRKNRKIML